MQNEFWGWICCDCARLFRPPVVGQLNLGSWMHSVASKHAMYSGSNGNVGDVQSDDQNKTEKHMLQEVNYFTFIFHSFWFEFYENLTTVQLQFRKYTADY